MGNWFTFYNTLAIVDNKTETYISNWYKSNKKNELEMKKEVDRLNIQEPWRYKLGSAFICWKWETTFDKNNY